MIYETGSRANCEHCGAVEWMISSRELYRATGEATLRLAGQMERAMFNGYAAPRAGWHGGGVYAYAESTGRYRMEPAS